MMNTWRDATTEIKTDTERSFKQKQCQVTNCISVSCCEPN
jgi:hypothetical protein